MPRLMVTLEGLPDVVPEGAAKLVTLRIRNVAAAGAALGPAAHRVRVRLPGSGLLVPADLATAGEQGTGGSDGGGGGNGSGDGQNGGVGGGGVGAAPKKPKPGGPQPAPIPTSAAGPGTVYAPPTWNILPAGGEVSMKMWLHPTAAGKLDLPFVVCYEPPPPAPALLKYRTVRLAAGAWVAPSLSVAASVLTAATHPAARVVRLTTVGLYKLTHRLKAHGFNIWTYI
jgi:hypothetical protein